MLNSVAPEIYVRFYRTQSRRPHQKLSVFYYSMSNSGRKKQKMQEALKIKTTSCALRQGNTIGELCRERRAASGADRRDYHVLERRHDGVARARDVTVAQCANEAERRRSAETLAAEP